MVRPPPQVFTASLSWCTAVNLPGGCTHTHTHTYTQIDISIDTRIYIEHHLTPPTGIYSVSFFVRGRWRMVWVDSLHPPRDYMHIYKYIHVSTADRAPRETNRADTYTGDTEHIINTYLYTQLAAQ